MIEIKNIKKEFKFNNILDISGDIKILTGVNSLVGLNGSGKTTLLKLLLGIIEPERGEVIYDGKNVIDYIDNIGVLFDKPVFHYNLSAIDNIRYFNSILTNKCTEDELLQLVKEWDIPKDNTPVKNYSLGMKKKLSIVISLLKKPDYWFLDEPFNGLDEQTKKKIINKIKSMRDDGKVILLISHDMKDNIELANHLLLIRDKKLHSIYNFDNLYTESSNVNIVISNKEIIPVSILDLAMEVKSKDDQYKEIIIPSRHKNFVVKELSLKQISIEKIIKENFTLDYIYELIEKKGG